MDFKSNVLHIFLDLENCLVESWDNPWRLNVNRGLPCELTVLKRLNSRIEFHLFSFAVCNEADVATFRTFQSNIEEAFNLKFSHIVTKDQVMTAVKAIRKIQVLDEFELSQLFGKFDCFMDFVKFNKIENSILFDDTVDDIRVTLQQNDKDWNFETVNVFFE